MADFQEQAMGITGLTIDASSTAPSRAEFSTFLNDGVIDVTQRHLRRKPSDDHLFLAVSSEQTSQGLNLNGAKITSVVRESGTNNDWKDCSEIHASMQSKVVDSASLHLATTHNPVYTILDNGAISVFPAPGSDPNAFKVYYVNNSPAETDGTALDHASTGIKFFPKDKVHLVVLYAGMKSLQSKIADTTISDISVTAVPPNVPNSPNISSPGVGTVTLGSLGTAPTLTSTTLTTRVSFNDFFESGSLNPFDDSDPGVLSITAVPPDIPTITASTVSLSQAAPTYNKPTISLTAAPTIGNLTISVSAPTTPSDPSISSPTVGAITIASLPTAPAYTPPVVGGATEELTATMDADSAGYGTDADFLNFSKWFSVAGDLIEDQEDVELASAQLQKIQAYIATYQSALQNQLNNFNENNVVYQAGIQRNLQQAQIDMQDAHKEADLTLQAALQDYTLELQLFQAEVAKYQAQVNDEVQEYQQNLAGDLQVWQAERTTDLQQYGSDIKNELNEFNKENAEYQAQLQISIQNAQLEDAEEAKKLQKYSSDVQSYQADVSTQVQEYTQKFQRYSTELNTAYQAWQKSESDSLQQYQLDIQANLNEFNKDNVIYQSTVQEAIQNATIAAQEAQKEGDLTLQAAIQDYTLELQKYQLEYSGYTSEVSSQIQEYTQNLQADGVGYQWLQEQYARLKSEYDQAFMIQAPQQ